MTKVTCLWLNKWSNLFKYNARFRMNLASILHILFFQVGFHSWQKSQEQSEDELFFFNTNSSL